APDLAREGPLTLVFLEFAPPASAAVLGQQGCDVRMHRALARHAEERDGCPDHAFRSRCVIEQSHDVVAGLLQSAQGAGVDDALQAPDGVQQGLRLDDEFNGVEITYGSHVPSLPLSAAL